MKRPNLHDETLSRLWYESSLDRYRGASNAVGGIVKFYLHVDGVSEIEPLLARARWLLDDSRWPAYRAAAEEFAVERMLDLKNEAWLKEKERPVSAERFKKLMRLSAIHIDPQCDVTFAYTDGGLFAGHCIEVEMDADDRFLDVGISG